MLIKSNNFISDPLVSVVICSYNRTSSLIETIDSILNQNHCFPFEIIIGDDASDYEVRSLLNEYQSSYPEIVLLLMHETNIGLGANWASCVKLCRGKYLANCDNDDFWHDRDKLKIQVNFLEQNADYGMVHTDYREINRKSGKITDKIIHNEVYSESLIKANFYGRFKCCNSSVMYRKSIIDKYVLLDDYIFYQFPLQDWITWISIANFTKFHCIPVSTTTVGIETDSITRPKDIAKTVKRFKKEKCMYLYLCNKFSNDLVFNEIEFDKYVNLVLLNLAYTNSDFKTAKYYANKLQNQGLKSLKVSFALKRTSFLFFVLLKKMRLKYLHYFK